MTVHEAKYLRKKAGFADAEATLAAIKAEFLTYEAFTAWLKP